MLVVQSGRFQHYDLVISPKNELLRVMNWDCAAQSATDAPFAYAEAMRSYWMVAWPGNKTLTLIKVKKNRLQSIKWDKIPYQVLW